MVGVAGFEPATPLVPNGVAVLRSLLAHLLANYSVRGRMRLYGATNSGPKVLDFPYYKVQGRTRTNGAIRSFEPVGDPALGEIIRRHLDEHLVAGQHADAVLAHASGSVSDDLMVVLELDPKGGVRKQFRHHAGTFQQFFLRHSLSEKSFIVPPLRPAEICGGQYRMARSITRALRAVRQTRRYHSL